MATTAISPPRHRSQAHTHPAPLSTPLHHRPAHPILATRLALILTRAAISQELVADRMVVGRMGVGITTGEREVPALALGRVRRGTCGIDMRRTFFVRVCRW